MFGEVLLMSTHNICLRGRMLIMPPTSKKLEGHIASGTFVRACVRPSVRPCVRPLHFFGAYNF